MLCCGVASGDPRATRAGRGSPGTGGTVANASASACTIDEGETEKVQQELAQR